MMVKKILVFVETKRGADVLVRNLRSNGTRSEALHGDKDQYMRDRILNDFREGKCSLLIATDVAARGLDIKDIQYVVNFDFPRVMEDYIHRIGRCGRAGAKGIAISFFNKSNGKLAKELVRVLREAKQEEPEGLVELTKRHFDFGRGQNDWRSRNGNRNNRRDNHGNNNNNRSGGFNRLQSNGSFNGRNQNGDDNGDGFKQRNSNGFSNDGYKQRNGSGFNSRGNTNGNYNRNQSGNFNNDKFNQTPKGNKQYFADDAGDNNNSNFNNSNGQKFNDRNQKNDFTSADKKNKKNRF